MFIVIYPLMGNLFALVRPGGFICPAIYDVNHSSSGNPTKDLESKIVQLYIYEPHRVIFLGNCGGQTCKELNMMTLIIIRESQGSVQTSVHLCYISVHVAVYSCPELYRGVQLYKSLYSCTVSISD